MSPKEEKSEPRFSEPPPQIPNQSAPRNNYTNQNNQRVNNLPPRFQHQNKSGEIINIYTLDLETEELKTELLKSFLNCKRCKRNSRLKFC